MRLFKNKWFTRWARREGVPDAVLLKAGLEILEGRMEADLGGYLFKKRLPREGKGKRGGYRVLLGYRKPNSERVIFLYAYAKNVKDNITDKEREALSLAAGAFISATNIQVSRLLNEGSITEIKCHD